MRLFRYEGQCLYDWMYLTLNSIVNQKIKTPMDWKGVRVYLEAMATETGGSCGLRVVGRRLRRCSMGRQLPTHK
jgi:hypothetical protein